MLVHTLSAIIILNSIGCIDGRTFVKVEANEEVCFYEEMKVGEPLAVSFEVIQGGYLDIDVRILSPANEELYFAERQTEGQKSIVADKEGRYNLCFSNKMSTLTAKLVRFGIHPRHGELISREMEAVKEEQLGPVQEQVLRLSDRVLQLSEKEKSLRSRSERHQATADSTHLRSLLTSLLETAVLFSMNLWQIYNMRQFFEVKRVL